MMWIYSLLLGAIYPLLRFVAFFHPRLRENFALRKTQPDFNRARGKTHIWFHASSAGEFEQVRAVALAMRRRHKNMFFSFSYFSDSAWKAKKNDSVPDIFFALPFDFRRRMRKLVAAMQPDAMIIGKYDAWPNQVLAAFEAAVPVFLVSATLPQKSWRHRWPLNRLMHRVYSPMRQIFAINGEHAARFRKISPLNVSISGDTRFDAIAARLVEATAEKKNLTALRKLISGKQVLVAGSTYATSEEMLLQFMVTQPKWEKKPFVALIAPHHVGADRIVQIEESCAALGLKVERLSQLNKLGEKKVGVLIVDSLGVLPHLYPLAAAAYVGGGFEGSVHSVIEAAVAGVPMITGPAIANSAEACDLAERGLLTVLAKPDAQEFALHVENLCKTRVVRHKKIQSYFRERLGVSDRIVHTVMDELKRNS